MIIEFPKKYKVTVYFDSDPVAFVDVPAEYRQELAKPLMMQPWASVRMSDNTTMVVSISRAYDITADQAHAALCQLCEYVMSPPEVDREVWGDVLGEVG